MAFKNPCDLEDEVMNTGTECDDNFDPLAMTILMDLSVEFTPEDVAGDMLTLLKEAAHASGRDRILPVFGNLAPIADIQNTNADNVIETMPSGKMGFVRSGKLTRVLVTDGGGDCLEKIFYALNGKKGKGFIDVSSSNQVKMYEKDNGNFGAFPLDLVDAPLPVQADFSVTGKRGLRFTVDPRYFIKKARIFQSDQDLLDLQGLVPTALTQGVGPNTVTQIFINVTSICGLTDLVAEFPTEIAHANNFVVKKAGVVVTPSAAAVIAGQVRLTVATQASADQLVVTGGPALNLFTNGIENFDITKGFTAIIP